MPVDARNGGDFEQKEKGTLLSMRLTMQASFYNSTHEKESKQERERERDDEWMVWRFEAEHSGAQRQVRLQIRPEGRGAFYSMKRRKHLKIINILCPLM
jgi:hypothetical protein